MKVKKIVKGFILLEVCIALLLMSSICWISMYELFHLRHQLLVEKQYLNEWMSDEDDNWK